MYLKSEKGTKTVPNIEDEKQKWIETCQMAIASEELLLPPPNSINKKEGGQKGASRSVYWTGSSSTATLFWLFPKSKSSLFPTIRSSSTCDRRKPSNNSVPGVVCRCA
jgi:hypothetical protein